MSISNTISRQVFRKGGLCAYGLLRIRSLATVTRASTCARAQLLQFVPPHVPAKHRLVSFRRFSDSNYGNEKNERNNQRKPPDDMSDLETDAPDGLAEPETDSEASEEENIEMPPDAETLEEEISKEELLENKIKDLKEQLLRSLAEQENIRRIARNDVESARQFAIKSFAKSLLDTSDNLERALQAVPEDLRSDKDSHPVLSTLYEGIQLTESGLTKAFAMNGLVKFGDVGESFDPTKHDALFEYQDESKDSGTLGQVMKRGFMLNNRVLRPAEVGVVKKTHS